MSFFPTAEKWIADHGFDAYVREHGDALDDMLWSDLHKYVFGFRPRQPHHGWQGGPLSAR